MLVGVSRRMERHHCSRRSMYIPSCIHDEGIQIILEPLQGVSSSLDVAKKDETTVVVKWAEKEISLFTVKSIRGSGTRLRVHGWIVIVAALTIGCSPAAEVSISAFVFTQMKACPCRWKLLGIE
jgi:hypothetical protein